MKEVDNMDIIWEKVDDCKKTRIKIDETFVVPWETVEEYKRVNTSMTVFDKMKNAFKKTNIIDSNDEMKKAEAIRKYKELLDCGAITKEEFEKKKKELL